MRVTRALLCAVFFTSGFAALLYQTTWQRLLTFFGGSDVFSVTLVVAAFMAGLGIGSLAGGRLADRLSARGRLLAFGLAELGIALFAFASIPLLYGFLYQRLGEWPLPWPAIALVVFLALLWPTFLMGLSLPLLARAVVGRGAEVGERIGALYGWNTLGAAVGSLATVFVLVRLYGFPAAIGFGAWANLACAGAAVALAWRKGDASEEAGVDAPRDASVPPAAHGLGAWTAIYALSGFIALSLEILWFRVLGVAVKSNAFTFGLLLCFYLTGLGLGAVLGGLWARRTRFPVAAFFALQAGIVAYAPASLALLVAALGSPDMLGPLREYLAGSVGLKLNRHVPATLNYLSAPWEASNALRAAAGRFLELYALLPAWLVLAPTLLMGASFAMLQRAVQTDLHVLGRRVGRLQAANIAGATAGSILTGLVFLDLLGSSGTLRLLTLLGAPFPWLLLREALPRLGGAARLGATAALTLLVVAVCPPAGALWARLHGAAPGTVIHHEDGTGVSVVKADPGPPPRTAVLVNGLGHSWIPYGGIHTVLGALPALLHPAPRSVAVIGLGSGDTVYAVAGRPETETVDCVEILRPQWLSLRDFAGRSGDPGVRALLADRRIRYTFTDGRAFLLRERRRFDIIEADALFPDSAYAGNLYSVEYFDLLRRRLAPGGLAVTWMATERVRDTFLKAFPHVLDFNGLLVGANDEIAFDPDVLRARLRVPSTEEHYRRAGVDIQARLRGVLADGPVGVYAPSRPRAIRADLNSDLFPMDEFLSDVRLLPRRKRSPD
jgi:hypothetical protein